MRDKDLSMGCKVEITAGDLKAVGVQLVFKGSEFFYTTFVPAPKCSSCDTVMVPHSDIEWHCPNSGCAMHLHPIHNGTYPVKLA